MNKKWQIYQVDNVEIERIQKEYNINKLLATILSNRKITKHEDIVKFLQPKRSDFYNPYSAIEKMEMTDDPGYWINIFYEEYYGVPSIRAIPYDDWVETNGS